MVLKNPKNEKKTLSDNPKSFRSNLLNFDVKSLPHFHCSDGNSNGSIQEELNQCGTLEKNQNRFFFSFSLLSRFRFF